MSGNTADPDFQTERIRRSTVWSAFGRHIQVIFMAPYEQPSGGKCSTIVVSPVLPYRVRTWRLTEMLETKLRLTTERKIMFNAK